MKRLLTLFVLAVLQLMLTLLHFWRQSTGETHFLFVCGALSKKMLMRLF